MIGRFSVLGHGGADIVGRVEVLVPVSVNEGCVADEGEEADECLAGSADVEGRSGSMWVKGSEGRESIVQVDFGVRCIRVGVVAGRSVCVGAGGIGVGVGLILQCWKEVNFDPCTVQVVIW